MSAAGGGVFVPTQASDEVGLRIRRSVFTEDVFLIDEGRILHLCSPGIWKVNTMLRR